MEFSAIYARAIPPRRFRPETLFPLKLDDQKADQLRRLYAVDEVLNMWGIVIEAYHGKGGFAQYHCYQGFGQASANCHRHPPPPPSQGTHNHCYSCPRGMRRAGMSAAVAEDRRSSNCGTNPAAIAATAPHNPGSIRSGFTIIIVPQ